MGAVVRKITKVGRVTLPVEVREKLGIEEGDSLEIFINGDEIQLKKVVEDDEEG